MARSTKRQKSEHLNAAYHRLARGASTADAATALSRERGISLRQAYRYVEQAQALDHTVPVLEPSIPVTFKLRGDVVRRLRAHSTASGLALSEIVTRALEAFLAAIRHRGRHG